MPVIRNPGALTTGHGKASPDAASSRPALTGAGLAGPGPNIGQDDKATPNALTGAAVSLNAHLIDPQSPHLSTSIGHAGPASILWSSSAGGALNELVGGVMKRPPMLGEWDATTSFSGIPDWGYLKLRDGDLAAYPTPTAPGAVALVYSDTTVQNQNNVFPYLQSNVGPALDTEFTIPMGDPHTDWQFNTALELTGAIPGAGYGRIHIGAFTRDGDVGPAPLPITRSARLYPRPTGNDGETGRPARVPVVLSGTAFPADRGVLALLHFAPSAGGDLQTEFLAQPLISDETSPLSAQGRVVAALLMGNGMLGIKHNDAGDPCAVESQCDGTPGGVFGLGTDVDGKFDPFAFPGYASGQYGLAEVHVGVNANADPLNPPFDDLDLDGNPGTIRVALADIPAAGQVRLGTVLSAGEAVVNYGIPILGGTDAWYTVAPTSQNGSLGEPIHGDAIVDGNNFFRYRLPVLKDYTAATGLKWTPKGEDANTSLESARFFDQAAGAYVATYEDGAAVGANWRTAGVYDSFDEDYWPWQIARFRQRFLMPSIELDGDREEIGTYMLVHFQTEADFESFVVDGVFPWDSPAPYEVYGMSVVDSPEDVNNVANPWLEATAAVPPDGPGSLYGYAANPYHIQRSRIFMDPAGTTVPASSAADFDWTSGSTAGVSEHVTWISGVAYFTPRHPGTGVSSFTIDQCDISLAAGFWTSYRTDFAFYEAGVGPAIVASQNPVMLVTAPWGYSDDGAGLPSSLVVPVNTDPTLGLMPSTDYQLQWRTELPFTHLGSNGSGVFTDANAPLDADTLDLALPSAITLVGDDLDPSFSRDAKMRAHFRRPLNHIDPDTTNLPYAAADGHGEILVDVNGTVLMHTTRFDDTNQVGVYGNFVVGAVGAPPNTARAVFYTALKDSTEKFLDETYRYVSVFDTAITALTPYDQSTVDNLNGPGMGAWAAGPIETPVRIGLATAPWNEVSGLLMEEYLLDQAATTDLQVAGLPDRNPPIDAVATMPFPSTGILQYPQGNFSAAYPLTATHITAAQPDYSAATGLRDYTRCLDAAQSNGGDPIAAAGASELKLRIDGITLDDLLYLVPGPGGREDNRIAVLLKVPGLTTWMDVGRADGGGPSKQDAALDGAGCLVQGTETYTFTDPTTGHKGCYLRCNVGPVASLFANPGNWSAYTAGDPTDEVPVLVRVQMRETAVSYNLEHIATGVGTFEGPSKPGADPSDVRGILSISIVNPNDTLVPVDP